MLVYTTNFIILLLSRWLYVYWSKMLCRQGQVTRRKWFNVVTL